jgi:hypothetical protein
MLILKQPWFWVVWPYLIHKLTPIHFRHSDIAHDHINIFHVVAKILKCQDGVCKPMCSKAVPLQPQFDGICCIKIVIDYKYSFCLWETFWELTPFISLAISLAIYKCILLVILWCSRNGLRIFWLIGLIYGKKKNTATRSFVLLMYRSLFLSCPFFCCPHCPFSTWLH